MDGTAAAGSTGDVSDAGHIHPTDTSRAPAGFGLGVALNTLTAITDANDISETGWFCTVSTTSNLPSDRDTSYAGAIESVVRGTTYMCQRYYDYHAAKIYERIKNESGWGSWKLTSPTATEQELAYVERGSTASRAYAAGEYFCMNGQLYRATSTIASGVSFATGSSGNCTSVKAMDYYSNTWTPSNVTVATGNAPRNRYIRSGGFLVIYFAAALTTDLADVSTLEICSDVAATFGVTDILTPFVKAAAISTRTSAATGDIIFNLQYNSNKLTLMNRSGVTVPAANRNVFAWLMLGII